MRHLLFGLSVVSSLAGCKVNLQSSPDVSRACKITTAPICVQAGQDRPSDFAWLQANMFSTNCSGKDCHGAPENGMFPTGDLSFAEGYAYQALLGKDPASPGDPPLVAATYDPGFHLVEPGHPEESYLLFILHGLDAEQETAFAQPPDDVGFMPQNNKTLCCQKLDVVERWIAAGALP